VTAKLPIYMGLSWYLFSFVIFSFDLFGLVGCFYGVLSKGAVVAMVVGFTTTYVIGAY
jgi:hypothetical protein